MARFIKSERLRPSIPWFLTSQMVEAPFDKRTLRAYAREFVTKSQRSVIELVRLVGWAYWERRYRELIECGRRYSFMREWLLERHLLEFVVPPLYRKLQLTTRPHVELLGPEAHAVGFANLALNVNRALSPSARARHIGLMKHALNSTHGFLPLWTEYEVAAGLAWHGFDVLFADFEGDGAFDLLGRRSELEIEVECKFCSADIGIQIKRSDLQRFGTLFQDRFLKRVLQEGSSAIVWVSLAEEMPTDTTHLVALGEGICNAVAAGAEVVRIGDTTITVEPWPHGVAQPDHVHHFASELARGGGSKGAINIAWHGKRSAVVICFESRRQQWPSQDELPRAPEGLLKSFEQIEKQIREAAHQLSGTRPSIIRADIDLAAGYDKPARRIVAAYLEMRLRRLFASRRYLEALWLGFQMPPWLSGRAFYIPRPTRGTFSSGELSSAIEALCNPKDLGGVTADELDRFWAEHWDDSL